MNALKRLFIAIGNLFKSTADQATVVVNNVNEKIMTLDIIEKAEKEFKDKVASVDAYGNTVTELQRTIKKAERDLEVSKAELKQAEDEYTALLTTTKANPTDSMKLACKLRLSTLRRMCTSLVEEEKSLESLQNSYQVSLASIAIAKTNLRTRELDLKNVRSRYERYKTLNSLDHFTFAAAGADDTYFNKLTDLVDFEDAKRQVEKDLASLAPSTSKNTPVNLDDPELDAQVEADLANLA